MNLFDIGDLLIRKNKSHSYKTYGIIVSIQPKIMVKWVGCEAIEQFKDDFKYYFIQKVIKN